MAVALDVMLLAGLVHGGSSLSENCVIVRSAQDGFSSCSADQPYSRADLLSERKPVSGLPRPGDGIRGSWLAVYAMAHDGSSATQARAVRRQRVAIGLMSSGRPYLPAELALL